MPQRSTPYYQYALILLWGVACMVFFCFYYPHHLFYQEQNQLFLLSADYLCTYWQKPAWLACMAGDFLTQFYYYLYAGPAILTVALLTVGDLWRRSGQRAGLNRHAAFVAAMVLMTLHFSLCLGVNYRLSQVMALMGGQAAYLCSSWLLRRSKGWLLTLPLVIGLITYWLFGYGVWAYLLLTALDVALHRRKALLCLVPALLLIPLIMMAGPHCYYLTPGHALTYPGLGKLKKPDFILEKDFAVSDEYYFGHYDKVEQIVENAGERTDQMLFFYNLVQAQKGELPDHLLKYTPNQLGTFYAIGPETPRLVIINMNELYWTLGDMTMTERAAMMTNVFSPRNRNVRMIRRLAECNLVSGDTLAANKYLRLLQHTWAYRDWSDRITAHEPKAWRYIIEKQKFTNQADTIRLSDNLHMVMMELLDSNPANTAALDYILCSTLLLKDMDNFKRDYDRYCIDTGRPRRKKLYQQALMIYLAGTNAPQEEWSKYIYDQTEVQRFSDYNSHRGDPRFSDTYWYYFDTAKTPAP